MQDHANRAGMQNQLGLGGDQNEDDNMSLHESFDSQTDELDEKDEERYVKAYWRAEEG